jgi:hypothetical protein
VDRTPPAVAISAPVGGEDWRVGSSHAVTWSATDAGGVTSVDLAYSTNGGASFPGVIATGLANSGSYAWTVPNAPSATARLRVLARDAAGNVGRDSSAANFTIEPWLVTASAGAGGSVVPAGAVPVAEGANQHFSIQASPGNRVTVLTVDGAAVPPDTTYTFYNVTANHSIAAAFGDAIAPVVRVTSPVGGESWRGGSDQSITWAASDDGGVDSVNVDVSFNGLAGISPTPAPTCGRCPTSRRTARWCG